MDDVGRRPDPDHRGVADIHAAAIHSAHPHEGVVAGTISRGYPDRHRQSRGSWIQLAISKLSIITAVGSYVVYTGSKYGSAVAVRIASRAMMTTQFSCQ
jgi:hypothetical protein